MVNKNKVKLMTKLAFYEQTQGKEDFKISEYYRKDYAGFHTLSSILWVTVAYICIAVLILIEGMETLLAKFSVSLIVTMGAAFVIGYLATVIIFAIIANHVYNEKHKQARQRVKRYNHNLTRLLKMYEKEKK